MMHIFFGKREIHRGRGYDTGDGVDVEDFGLMVGEWFFRIRTEITTKQNKFIFPIFGEYKRERPIFVWWCHKHNKMDECCSPNE